MRLLGRTFLDAFPNAILNIHPSLLPAFPGVDAQRQAWEYGDQGRRRDGALRDRRARRRTDRRCSARCRFKDADTPETLAARILEVEHRDLSRKPSHSSSTAAGPSRDGDSRERG